MNAKRKRKLEQKALKAAKKKRLKEVNCLDNLLDQLNNASESNKIPVFLEDKTESAVEKLINQVVNEQGHIDLSISNDESKDFDSQFKTLKKALKKIDKERNKIASSNGKVQKIKTIVKGTRKNTSVSENISSNTSTDLDVKDIVVNKTPGITLRDKNGNVIGSEPRPECYCEDCKNG